MYITSRRQNSYSASRHFPGSNNFLLNIPQIIRYSHLVCSSNHVYIKIDNIGKYIPEGWERKLSHYEVRGSSQGNYVYKVGYIKGS